MPITHNQINFFWRNPSYVNFKKSSFVKKIFKEKDAEDFYKTGAYLILQAKTHTKMLIPWDSRKRLEILKHPRLENVFISVGTEYLLKGIFLAKGFSINKKKNGIRGLQNPILLKNNLGKFSPYDVLSMDYFVRYIHDLIDFSEFDQRQQKRLLKERAKYKGRRLGGITSMSIPYPSSNKLLEYLHFKRNYALHRPFIISEFGGITKQKYELLDYVAKKAFGDSLKKLAILIEKD